jgi:hypothetical protein
MKNGIAEIAFQRESLLSFSRLNEGFSARITEIKACKREFAL